MQIFATKNPVGSTEVREDRYISAAKIGSAYNDTAMECKSWLLPSPIRRSARPGVRPPRADAIVFLLMFLAALTGCSSAGTKVVSTVAPDPRIMAITANPVPPQDAISAANFVAGVGARGAVSSFTWSALETSPEAYSLQNLNNNIAFFSLKGFTIYLGIQVINTVPKETPSDLLGVAWSDPNMKSRFHALLDAIHPLLTPQVHYISIGNEVDVYLTNHPLEWASYQNFYEDALSYIHQTMPGIQVGVTATFSGAAGAAQANVVQLNTMSDVWIFTYYPLGPGFVPKGPQSPLNDFTTMLALAGTRQVLLQEVGYPTSSIISSSEGDQAAFVTNVFQTWETHMQQMPFLNYFLLHDLASNTCSSIAQYYNDPNDPTFQAYLCSLGLRNTDDTPKLGWESLVSVASSEGFPH